MNGNSLEAHIARAKQDFADTLHWLNDQQRQKIEQDIYHEVVHNCKATLRYEHLDPYGPRIEKITIGRTFVPRYSIGLCQLHSFILFLLLALDSNGIFWMP